MTTEKLRKLILVAVLILMLPLLAFPHLLAVTPEEHKVLLWLYPPYVITSGYLACKCYPYRVEMTYILLLLLILSHMAIWLLSYAK